MLLLTDGVSADVEADPLQPGGGVSKLQEVVERLVAEAPGDDDTLAIAVHWDVVGDPPG